MAKKESLLNEITEYPRTVTDLLSADKNIVGLILDKNPDNVTGADMDAVCEQIFDHAYVPGTIQEAKSYIFVDCAVPRVKNENILDLSLVVQICVHTAMMKPDKAIFKGWIGNRCNNITKHVGRVLTHQDIFGIGNLSLCSIDFASLQSGHVLKQLEYRTCGYN